MVSSNDVGRLFLQSIISRRVVSDKLAKVLWGKCVEAVRAADEDLDVAYDPNRFHNFINDLNNRLSPLDLKLSVTVDEVKAKKIWVMVNTKGDELAQVATDYTPVEIAYFKAVVEQIVLAPSESYSISSMAALREVSGLKPTMSKTQAEATLANFVAKGWLLKSEKRGRFSLSSRALLELQAYLKANYEDDIHECTLCFDLLTKGIGCFTPACNARLHDHCYKRFVRDNSTCPSCRTDWSQPQKLVTIGEGAVRDGDYGRRRTKKRSDDDEEEEDEIESEEEAEPEPRPTGKSSTTAAKGKKRPVQEEDEDGSSDEEMNVDNEERPAPVKSQGRRWKR